MQALTKLEVRNFLRPNGRDWIHVGATLPTVTQLAPREEGASAWYVVMTNPRCEKRAQSGLIEKGFGVYLPQYRMERIVKRTKERVIVSRSLFPRYMFVLAPHGSWPRITSVDGIECLVREFGRQGAPVAIADDVITKLMDRQNGGAFDKMRDRPFVKGDEVRVVKGPFFTFSATVSRVLADDHADILVELFGRSHEVRIPFDHMNLL